MTIPLQVPSKRYTGIPLERYITWLHWTRSIFYSNGYFQQVSPIIWVDVPHDHYFIVVRRHRWRSRSSRLLESKFKCSVSIVFDFATGTRSGQESSYVRKNSQMASFAKNNMPNTTWKSYARKRNSTVHQWCRFLGCLKNSTRKVIWEKNEKYPEKHQWSIPTFHLKIRADLAQFTSFLCRGFPGKW